MSRKLTLAVVLGMALWMAAMPAFAQAEGGQQAQHAGKSTWLLITAGFAMAMAAAGCGYAQSRALTAACEGVSRNPGATDTIRIFTFLGLAFIEFLALLTFVVIMLLMYTTAVA
jgi:F-type H+-transporting ATPase subunit c